MHVREQARLPLRRGHASQCWVTSRELEGLHTSSPSVCALEVRLHHLQQPCGVGWVGGWAWGEEESHLGQESTRMVGARATRSPQILLSRHRASPTHPPGSLLSFFFSLAMRCSASASACVWRGGHVATCSTRLCTFWARACCPPHAACRLTAHSRIAIYAYICSILLVT